MEKDLPKKTVHFPLPIADLPEDLKSGGEGATILRLRAGDEGMVVYVINRCENGVKLKTKSGVPSQTVFHQDANGHRYPVPRQGHAIGARDWGTVEVPSGFFIHCIAAHPLEEGEKVEVIYFLEGAWSGGTNLESEPFLARVPERKLASAKLNYPPHPDVPYSLSLPGVILNTKYLEPHLKKGTAEKYLAAAKMAMKASSFYKEDELLAKQVETFAQVLGELVDQYPELASSLGYIREMTEIQTGERSPEALIDHCLSEVRLAEDEEERSWYLTLASQIMHKHSMPYEVGVEVYRAILEMTPQSNWLRSTKMVDQFVKTGQLKEALTLAKTVEERKLVWRALVRRGEFTYVFREIRAFGVKEQLALAQILTARDRLGLGTDPTPGEAEFLSRLLSEFPDDALNHGLGLYHGNFGFYTFLIPQIKEQLRKRFPTLTKTMTWSSQRRGVLSLLGALEKVETNFDTPFWMALAKDQNCWKVEIGYSNGFKISDALGTNYPISELAAEFLKCHGHCVPDGAPQSDPIPFRDPADR